MTVQMATRLTLRTFKHKKRKVTNKSPGTDGLPCEFYKSFWAYIQGPLLNSINYSFEKGELSVSQKRGIITLLPKKGK